MNGKTIFKILVITLTIIGMALIAFYTFGKNDRPKINQSCDIKGC